MRLEWCRRGSVTIIIPAVWRGGGLSSVVNIDAVEVTAGGQEGGVQTVRQGGHTAPVD